MSLKSYNTCVRVALGEDAGANWKDFGLAGCVRFGVFSFGLAFSRSVWRFLVRFGVSSFGLAS